MWPVFDQSVSRFHELEQQLSDSTIVADRARFARIVHGHQTCVDLIIFENDVVGDVFNAAQLVGRDRLLMHEVEAQSIRRDQRATLGDVIAEHLAKRLVQQMRRGVIAANFVSSAGIHNKAYRIANFQAVILDVDVMDKEIANLFLSVADLANNRPIERTHQ